jgi:diguanylate cyclase
VIVPGIETSLNQATHDALTGLANYREFLDALEREVRRSERSNRTFAVLLLDLDELKRINDRLGHLAGNRALKRLSNVMKGNAAPRISPRAMAEMNSRCC